MGAGGNVDNLKAVQHEWCDNAGIDDILFFIKKGVTVQQYKEIIPILNKSSNSSQELNSNQNVITMLRYMNNNNISAQEAFDKMAAKGFYTPVEVSPQRTEEIREILQRSPYNIQQRLKPYLDDSIKEVSTYMDKHNLSAQDAINKIMADRDQDSIQSSLKEWGSVAAKKCHNKIYDLEDTWTGDKAFANGTYYSVRAKIFQRLNANTILSKIIVYSDYQFKLIYLHSSKSISDGEDLLVVPMQNFRYRNLADYQKEINGFRVIQQQ